MSERENSNKLKDAFILVEGNSIHLFEKVIHDIEMMEGQTRQAFPPRVIFASIPAGKIEELRASSEVAFITTEEIGISPPLLSADEFPEFVSVWNQYIKSNRYDEREDQPDKDLSWDAPGHLPPDPPPHLREIMKKWEDDMNKSADN